MRLRGFDCLCSLFPLGIFNGHVQAHLFQSMKGLFGIGDGFSSSFWFIRADGHRYAGHLRNELFDELLAVLVGADEIPEGLSPVDQHTGAIEIRLGLNTI